jgi:hypothetical protein
MRAQSLWANLQGIPAALFNFQGDSAERSVQEIQSTWWLLGFGVGLTRSKRDSRTAQRISSKGLKTKETRAVQNQQSLAGIKGDKPTHLPKQSNNSML